MSCQEFRRRAGKGKIPAPHSSASPALSAPAPPRTRCGAAAGRWLQICANRPYVADWDINAASPVTLKRARQTRVSAQTRVPIKGYVTSFHFLAFKSKSSHQTAQTASYRRLLWRRPSDRGLSWKVKFSCIAGAHTCPLVRRGARCNKIAFAYTHTGRRGRARRIRRMSNPLFVLLSSNGPIRVG